LALAVLIGIVWSIVDFRRPSYSRLHEILRITLRYSLALIVLGYGVAKIIPPRQFQLPSADRLMTTYGDSSPMGLLWTFMGASVPYTIFGGISECIGAVLLFFRRTATLGALITASVMLNIVMMNYCYDVPVKLYSSHLLAIALYLTLPDVGRLLNVLVFNRTAVARQIALPIQRRWLRVTVYLGKIALLGWIAWTYSQRGQRMVPRADERLAEIAGSYEVESFRRDGEDLPPLITETRRWRVCGINQWGRLVVRPIAGERRVFNLKLDETGNKLLLNSIQPTGTQLTWDLSRPDADHLQIDGTYDNATVSVRLKKIDVNQFLLMNRGFRWINEFPYNR
jgi:uncharacterized membrane protein YphA (DoxX/SURF4 family)